MEGIGGSRPVELSERRSLAALLAQGLEALLVGLLDAFARLDEGSDLLNRVEDLGGLVGLPGDLREDRRL